MSYAPPSHNAVNFSFQGASAYNQPAYNAANFGFLAEPTTFIALATGIGSIGAPMVLGTHFLGALAQGFGALGIPQAGDYAQEGNTVWRSRALATAPNHAKVLIYDWETREPIQLVDTNEGGYWWKEMIPGIYGITYQADNCGPITHGPYTVT